MGQRRDRLDGRLARAKATRQTNSTKKEFERERRKSLNVKIIKAGKFPYTPAIMSWLSSELDKKASQITEADVKTVTG